MVVVLVVCVVLLCSARLVHLMFFSHATVDWGWWISGWVEWVGVRDKYSERERASAQDEAKKKQKKQAKGKITSGRETQY